MIVSPAQAGPACRPGSERQCLSAARRGRWRSAQNFPCRIAADDRFSAANLSPGLALPDPKASIGPKNSSDRFVSVTGHTGLQIVKTPSTKCKRGNYFPRALRDWSLSITMHDRSPG